MSDLIQRAREALVDVTPGPWAVDAEDQGVAWGMSYSVHRHGNILYEIADTVCEENDARFIAVARDLVPAMADRLEAQEALLREVMAALGKLHHAVCGETGFAQCVRDDSKTLYPWPALDVADHAASATLAKLRAHLGETE